MTKALRAILGLAFVAGLLWCSFHVPLGELTFAQHMDRIGQTPEAEQLLEGSRDTVRPVLEEATDRMLGEYIEAPTVEDDIPALREGAGPPSTPDSVKLPGGGRP